VTALAYVPPPDFDAGTALFYFGLFAAVLFLACVLDGLLTLAFGPDPDLRGPWDPRR
jgi:hypothetical protein